MAKQNIYPCNFVLQFFDLDSSVMDDIHVELLKGLDRRGTFYSDHVIIYFSIL